MKNSTQCAVFSLLPVLANFISEDGSNAKIAFLVCFSVFLASSKICAAIEGNKNDRRT